ncbi:MAG: tRNA pseudouridine(13) synthase TruD [Candidatus Aenigmarchaeota archaeon]|nr:tRNA pseudouridine(13) synthase TruD [Candidatus Aenigmarchaeota archaeon]
MLPYWTRSAGTGGKIKSPEDFIVKETIHRKYFAKYRTAGGVSRKEGKYDLFLLRKRNMTTHEALALLRKRFGAGKIGFAGLKDKKAVTEQHITMEGGSDFKENGIELVKAGTSDKMLSKGNLIGNEFIITLHGCNAKKLQKVIAEINKRGFPNYFGPQRFGAGGNNHAIGRLIVKRKFDKALQLINKSYGKDYKEIFHVKKEILKFFVNAYQSWIFNETLAGYVRKGKYFSGFIPLIGCNTKKPGKSSEIMKREKISPKDFMVSKLRLSCSGGERKAFIKTYLKYTINGNKALLNFTLPPGSYATVVLREVTKKEVR